MPVVSIRFDGLPSPNETYSIGDTVTLSNNDDTGVSSWFWSLQDKPSGSSADIAVATNASTTISPDLEGSYRVKLTVNGTVSGSGVARVLTAHVGLKALAHNEVNEGDLTEGWAKPWRESYQSIDRRLGLADYRTVIYSGSTVSGSRVLSVVGTGTLSNGDAAPLVRLMYTPSTNFIGSRIMFLWESGTLSNGATARVLARGMSAPVVNPQYYVSSYDFGIRQYTQLYAGGDSVNNLAIEFGSISFREQSTAQFGGYVKNVTPGNEYYIGTCVQSASDGSGLVRIWFDPTGNNGQEGHGFHPSELDGSSHAVATTASNGFMSTTDKYTFDLLRKRPNFVDNGAFDFWQRGSVTGTLSESLSGTVFTSSPQRRYIADRWYATAYNNFDIHTAVADYTKQSSSGSVLVSALFSGNFEHENCLRIRNRSLNTGDVGNPLAQGIRYFAIQEIDRNIVRYLTTAKPNVNLFCNIRKGVNFPDSATVGLGMAFSYGDVSGTFPNFANINPDTGPLEDLNYFLPEFDSAVYLDAGTVISSDYWSPVGVTGLIPPFVSGAAIFLVVSYDSNNDGGTEDFIEFTNVGLVEGFIDILDPIYGLTPFVNAGGTRETDLARCRKFYEKSYPIDTAPGTSSSLGMKTGVVTSAGNRVAPGVLFRETKNSGSSGFVNLFSPSGVSDRISLLVNGLVTGSAVTVSSEGFFASITSGTFTAGGEAQFHFTASFDI